MTNAPTAPGRIGDAIEPMAAQTYLQALDEWVRGRRTELDELDAAAISAGRGQDVSDDMTLSMALWKAVSDRYQLLSATFDGGRVGRQERERLSALIWGRLDGTLDPALRPGATSLAVSLPEACRLSDALAVQLRTALSLVPGADAGAARLKDLRAQLERLRDQVALEPANNRDAATDAWKALVVRTAEVTEKAQRGGDVGGMLGPLEQDATRMERDLIVGNAQRRDARDQVLAAKELRADLEAREAALTQLAAACVRAVDPAPHHAVPDVSALGPVPVTAAEIRAYRSRLDRVSQAMTLAQDRYSAALDERTELVDLLEGYVAKARALGVAGDSDLASSERQARDVLDREPTPLAVARQLVTTYQTWLGQLLADHAPRHPKESA